MSKIEEAYKMVSQKLKTSSEIYGQTGEISQIQFSENEIMQLGTDK